MKKNKNIKEWCGGDENKTHYFVWRKPKNFDDWLVLTCAACGELKQFWVSWWAGHEKPIVGSSGKLKLKKREILKDKK